MFVNIYGDKHSYVTDEVSSVNVVAANSSEDSRIKYVTDLASISRGKTKSSNPKATYERLLQEAAPNKYVKNGSASRPLEFIPVVMHMHELLKILNIKSNINGHMTLYFGKPETDMLVNGILRYSYLHNDMVYTNMRALLNIGLTPDKIPYNLDNMELLHNYKIVRVKVPMFVFAQLQTHTALSKESQSDRVTVQTDYWLPIDLVSKLNANRKIKVTEEDVLEMLLKKKGQSEIQNMLKEMQYPKEIWSRAPFYFKYKETILGGWYIDPNTWKHLFLERNCETTWDNWTQKETQQAVSSIKQVVEYLL